MSADLPSRSGSRRAQDAGARVATVRSASAVQNLAITQFTTLRWSLLEEIERLPAAGISAIALWRSKLERFGEERAIELISDSNLEVTSLSWAGGFTGSAGLSFRESIDDARHAIRLAQACGARFLHVVTGGRNGHTLNHARRLAADALRHLADLAAEHDVTLAVQPMHPLYAERWTFLNNLDAAVDLLSECDHPHLKLAFGTYHLWQQPRLLERLPLLAEMLGTVQISDGDVRPEHVYQRVPLGDGRIPLKPMVQTLLSAGFSGPFEIDLWSDVLWQLNDYSVIVQAARGAFQQICEQ